MKIEKAKAPLWILGIFVLCEAVKDFEFLVLKTDQTFLAENILCKLFTIGVVFIFLRKYSSTWGSIGFHGTGFLKGAVLGLGLGVVTFFLSYLVELLILQGMGLHPEVSFYISNFTISGQNITGVSLPALAICLTGNIFNVWAEEGLFRGLLFQIGKSSYPVRTANLIQAVLFGIWHIIVVIVWLAEGSIGIAAAIIMAAGYVVLAGILGYEWGLCYLLTGTLWTGVFEHFFNNLISNSLHVVTENGADELQIVRIVLSNILSLLIVVILSAARRHGKTTQPKSKAT